MKIDYRYAITLFIILYFTIACSDEIEENKTQSRVIVKDKENITVAEFKLNNDKKVISSWSKEQLFMDEKRAEMKYTYDSNGLLKEATGFIPGNMILSSIFGAWDKNLSTEYYYNDAYKIDSISKVYKLVKEPKTVYNFSYRYSYTEPGIIKMEYIMPHIGENIRSYSYYYFNALNNIDSIVSFSNNNNSGIDKKYQKRVFEYDNNIKPFYGTEFPEPQNNITKQTTFYYFEGENNSIQTNKEVILYDITYNDNNLPNKIIKKRNNDQEEIRKYKYK